MSRFYVGQRVKKVAGLNLGKEAIVYDFSPTYWWADQGCDMRVVLPEGTVCENRFDQQVSVMGGVPVSTKSNEWVPISRPHEACDTEFKVSLDELLARQEQPA